MGSCELRWKSSALGDLATLPRAAAAACLKKIESLKRHPFPRGYKKIQGTERTYRLRVGHYRIVYQVDVPLQVIIVYHIRHRKDVSRALPR